MLSVIILSVIMLNVIMLNVAWPSRKTQFENKDKKMFGHTFLFFAKKEKCKQNTLAYTLHR